MKVIVLAIFLSLFSSSGFAARILHFGDSQVVGPIGERLHHLLRKDNQVCSRGEWGAKPSDFSNPTVALPGRYKHCTRDLKAEVHVTATAISRKVVPVAIQETLEVFRPDTVLIQLGGNIIKDGGDVEYMRENIKSLLTVIKKYDGIDQCVWIGPPESDKRPRPEYGNFFIALDQALSELEMSCLVYRSDWLHLKEGVGDAYHLNYVTEYNLRSAGYCGGLLPMATNWTQKTRLRKEVRQHENYYSKLISEWKNGGNAKVDPFFEYSCRSGKMMGIEWALDIGHFVSSNLQLEIDESGLASDYNEYLVDLGRSTPTYHQTKFFILKKQNR